MRFAEIVLKTQIEERDKKIEQLQDTIATLDLRAQFLAITLRGVEDGLSIHDAKDAACRALDLEPCRSLW